jgi:stalled ribosome rescue protein Dom34
MKHQVKKQYAGVWIDNQKAIIITSSSDNDGDYSIKEKLKADENFGGGSEHSINNARQSDNLKYFKTISNQLLKYDEILIFGPGKSQEQLQNHLEEDAQFNKKKISIDSAEHLTDPQMIAKVRDFFK